MAPIAKGDKVTLHYRGRLEDGTEFDSSYGREPLEFTAGSDDLIEGVSQAVIGMATGDQQTVTVPPEQGYGERHEGLEIQVQRSQLPDDVDLGAVLGLTAGEHQIQAVLVELGDEHAVLDGNHPLAGKTLVFDLEILSVVA
jgi:peptidylprolyl isomerase